MPVIDPRWKKVSPEQWRNFAEGWLTEIREKNSAEGSDLGTTVVSMNLFAAPELQWEFILLTVSIAETDMELAAIAAGPIQHLLGKFGEQYIDQVEKQAATDPKFFRVLSGIRGERSIDDKILLRIQRMKEQISEPIDESAQRDAHNKRIQSEEAMLERLEEERRVRAEKNSKSGE